MLADLKAVAELGWIAGCGVLLCALSCFVGHAGPARAVRLPAQRDGAAILPLARGARNTAAAGCPRLMRRPRLVLAVSALVHARARLFRLAHPLRSQPAQPAIARARFGPLAAQDDRANRRRATATPSAITNTPEEALALKARYEQLPEREPRHRGRVADPARPEAQARDACTTSSSGCASCRRAAPSSSTMCPTPTSLVRAADRAARRHRAWQQTRPSAFLAELNDDLAAPATRGLRRTTPASSASACSDFQMRIGADLMDDLHRLRDVATPAADHARRPADEPARALRRQLRQMAAARSSPRNACGNTKPARRSSRQVQTVDSEATGKPFTTLEGLKAMRRLPLGRRLRPHRHGDRPAARLRHRSSTR